MSKSECIYCGKSYLEEDSTAVEISLYCTEVCEDSDEAEDDRLN